MPLLNAAGMKIIGRTKIGRNPDAASVEVDGLRRRRTEPWAIGPLRQAAGH